MKGSVRLQLRIAREFSGASGPVPRVLWVPKWLPGSRDTKRDPFEVLKKFGPLQQGEEVYAEEATDLSQMLRARLAPPPPAAGIVSVTHLLVVAAVAEDDGLVGPLANRLQSTEFKVKPRYSNDTEPLGDFDQASVVLLLWDKASQVSIEHAARHLSGQARSGHGALVGRRRHGRETALLSRGSLRRTTCGAANG